jgi:hypothetical protein
MRGPVTSSLVLVIAVGMGAVRAQTEQGPTAELERRFDASLDAREMAAWMKTMAAEPNHVGSMHDRARRPAPIDTARQGRPRHQSRPQYRLSHDVQVGQRCRACVRPASAVVPPRGCGGGGAMVRRDPERSRQQNLRMAAAKSAALPPRLFAVLSCLLLLFFQLSSPLFEEERDPSCLGLRRPRDFNRVTSATMAGLNRMADMAGM